MSKFLSLSLQYHNKICFISRVVNPITIFRSKAHIKNCFPQHIGFLLYLCALKEVVRDGKNEKEVLVTHQFFAAIFYFYFHFYLRSYSHTTFLHTILR